MVNFIEFTILNSDGKYNKILVNRNSILFCREIKYTKDKDEHYGTFMALSTPLYDDKTHEPVNTNAIICEPYDVVKKKIFLKG